MRPEEINCSGVSNISEKLSNIMSDLGTGRLHPCAYDTGHVARLAKNGVPQFPMALEWLRSHQKEDGSWGSPLSTRESFLNTLSALVALATWNLAEDQKRMQKAVEFLKREAPRFFTDENDLVGVEVLIPSLIQDGKRLGLPLNFPGFEEYGAAGNSKIRKILTLLETSVNGLPPATWWHSVEMLGDLWTPKNEQQLSQFVSAQSGVTGSPSATSYVVRKAKEIGVTLPEAEKYLEDLYVLHGGGFPVSAAMDLFELAFGIDYLLKGGFTMTTLPTEFQAKVAELDQAFDPEKGLGFSKYVSLSDTDDVSVALSVLHHFGHKKALTPLLSKFNGTNFETYKGESTSSLSVNLNCISALKLYVSDGNSIVNEILGKTLQWVDSKILPNKTAEKVFGPDKWHVSPYYVHSRAVFVLSGLRDEVVKGCLQYMVASQNKDGGWGIGSSTLEETALVVLALAAAKRTDLSSFIPWSVLQEAETFLSQTGRDDVPLGISKVFYYSPVVTELQILGALHSVRNLLEQKRTEERQA